MPAITGSSTMQEVLDAYPSAQRALFQRYHIGGCSSCGYAPDDKLETVAANHDITDVGEVIAFLEGAAEADKKLKISVEEVKAALGSPTPPKLLDVRMQEEWNVAHLEGARLFTREVNMEMTTWPKDTAVVFYCHTGQRSMDAASFFAGHGFFNVRSMEGGIDAWSQKIDGSVPRYEIKAGPTRGSASIRPLSESLPN